MPVRIILTEGTIADCSQAVTLIDGLPAEYLLADKGYDTDALLAQIASWGAQAVIPSRVFDLVDIAFNTLAASVAVAARVAIGAARQGRGV